MRKILKKNNGITLVSLVVTIIVLLILAGVSLSLVAGSNGIMSKAVKATDKYVQAAEKEILELVQVEMLVEQDLKLDETEDVSEIIAQKLSSGGRKAGVVQDEEELGNYIVTFDLTNNIYYCNVKTGKIEYIGTYTESENEVEIEDADIKFTQTETEWTNENIETVIFITQGIDLTNFVLQYSKDGKNWSIYSNPIQSIENETIYARVKHKMTGQIRAIATSNIQNIDKTKPQITEVIATTNQIKIKAIDKESGIVGFAVTESTEKPNIFETCDETSIFDTIVTGKKQGQTYYVWVKDKVGNISECQSITLGEVKDITNSDLHFEYSEEGWTNQNVIVNIIANIDIEGYTLQVSTDGINWIDGDSYEFSSNGTLYVILRDEVGQQGNVAASVTVQNIDKTPPAKPNINNPTNGNATSQNFSLTVSSVDTGSGIAYYEYSYDQVNWVTYQNSDSNSFVTTPFSAERNQLVYIRCFDKVGNVSEVSSTNIWIDRTPPTIIASSELTVNVGTTINENYLKSVNKISDNLGNALVTDLQVKNSSNGVVGATLSGYDIYTVTYNLKDEAKNSRSVSQIFKTKPTSGVSLTNIVTDPGFEQGSTKWTMNNITRQTAQRVSGSYGIQFTTGNHTTMLSQSISKPIANHTYYGSRMMKTVGGNASANDCRFEMFIGDGADMNYVFSYNNGNYPNWTRVSGVIRTGTPKDGSWIIRSFQVTPSGGTLYQDEYMIIDLTQGFGSNIPSKQWLDQMISYFEGTRTFTW